jgi:hypothetical protein
MTRDQSLDVQLVNGAGEPACIENVIVEVQFFTGGRFRYGFKLGRTDVSGHVRASYADIETRRQKNAAENLMDYNTDLDACDPTAKLVVPSEAELRKQRDNATRFYQEPPAWADPWPANGLVHPTEKLVELTSGVNQIELSVLG